MITCDDIDGACCDSCHEDYQLGWDGGGYDEMCEVYVPGADVNAPMFAHVCCRKVDEATALMEKEVNDNAGRTCGAEALQAVPEAPSKDDSGA